MATSVTYIATGTAGPFNIPFPYIDRTHIEVLVNDVVRPASEYTFPTASSIQFVAAPAVDSEIVIRRATPAYPITEYQSGGVLTKGDLETDSKQALFLIEEFGDRKADTSEVLALIDSAGGSLGAGILRDDLMSTEENKGSNLFSFIQSGAGAVARTGKNKMRDVVHADDFGLVGDGVVDDSVALQALFNAAVGKVAMLGNGKVYRIGASSITIPSGTTLVSNGSKIKRAAAGAVYGLVIQGNLVADALVYETVGGASDAGVQISGDNVHIGRLSATSLSTSGTAAAVNGVFIHVSDLTPVKDVWIGRMYVKGWEAPFRTRNVDGIYLGPVRFENYRTGYYGIDTKNGVFFGAHISGTSPNAVGGPGDNGLLLESTVTNGCENLRFFGWHVRDSGEHAFRLGGQRTIRNVWFYGCSSRNTGAAGAGATGGAGFKVLGGWQNNEYHENIHIHDFVAEDCSVTGNGVGNFTAIQIGMVKRGSFKFTVARRNNAHSCWDGFSVLSSEEIHLYPVVSYAKRNAGHFITAQGTTPPYPTLMQDVIVHGGSLHVDSTTSSVVVWDPIDNTFDNVSIKDGCLLTGGIAGTYHTAPTTGGYVNCSVDIVRIRAQVTDSTPPTFNQNNILVKMVGPLYGSFHTQGANGSVVHDTTANIVKQRVNDSWWVQGVSSGTWTPTLTLVSNVDAATVVAAWRWMRVGNTVQFSGTMTVDNTAASALSEVGISLPVASNFSTYADASGVGVASTPNGLCGTLQADQTNDRLALRWQAGSTSDNRAWTVTGSYEVK